ncbi:hypothetical protein DUI87_31057 [Hirundo rustica rustica]|uniref:Cilia- and flagella-associated protein 46 n=1 Tax=Hirundo rustica rustica TaxID=333673 RepID=A0A3M0IUL5_HIRRU|nr:hypothetical protein DUI87_31057 [Hirundo rustica rustica]
MELAVRERLLAAERAGDVQALKNAYELIKSASEGQSALDSSENISTDLYVLCAEQALQEEFEKFVLFFMKAIDFATHDRRYFFLIYNASVLYWQLVRPFLKPGFRYCLIPSLSQIVTALNQIEEQDNEWRAELMINLLECFLDASKLEEAKEFSSTAAVFIKENVPDKYSQIFSLMEQGKLIEIECLECEYEMKKNDTEIVTYTKGVVEAQLKLIKNLELTLKRAVQLGNPDVIQVVCATQWNLCLPLLQHNLHQLVRKPLISVADVLEEIDSMLILLRCQVHMEIARIEEDEDSLEAALEHLQKAMHLNNSGQYQEYLSFNCLRLSAMLYESRGHLEDQAVMLIEQAKRGKQTDNVRKKRSLLVKAGLALAPDTFQIVLDSENEAKGRQQSIKKATVHLLRLQGIKLNDHAVPPEATYQCHPGCVSYLPESDPEWKTYSLWIDSLSRYAMENFQRAAEIGEELNEAWIVHNAVVYVLNYNRHMISSGRQREIVEYLQTLLGAIKTVGHNGSIEILLMLCNALARGLIISWIPKPKPDEKKEDTAIESSRKAAAKKQEKANITQSFSVDPGGLPGIKAALEICEFALNAMTGTVPKEKISLPAQQQIIATWVKAKQLNQQQIRHELGTQEENKDETQNPLAKILIGLEMYSCNGLGLMDFTAPSLSQLVNLALECSWSDPLVKLQTLARLTYFAYVSQDYERVMTCSKRILESDENSVHNRNFKKYGMYAGEAGNYSLVMFAARHFWNACLPLLGSPHDREQFKEPTKIILKSIIKAESKNKQVTSLPSCQINHTTHLGVIGRFAGSALNPLNYVSNEDTEQYWLQYPWYWYPLSLIFKLMATVRAGSGSNSMMDIQRVSHESEDCLSHMWRHLVTVSGSAVGQLRCFQNAIIALQKKEDEWQRVDYLMEFAECLYCNQFPLNDAIKPLEWAVDLLLRMKFPVQSTQEEGIVTKAFSKTSQPTIPQKVQSKPPKTDKDKKKEKQVEVSVAEEEPKGKESADTLPASVEEWAQYDCPNEIRDTFKQKTNSYGINWDNFPKPLAEVIASEVLECRSLSDLYHLRIALICSDLKLSQASVYHEKAAGDVYISELEQAMCRQEIARKKEKTVCVKTEERKISFENLQLNGIELFKFWCYLQACEILERTVNVFRSTLLKRPPGRQSELGFMIASLEARKTLIQIHFTQDHMTVNANSAQLPHILQESYNKLVQVEKDFFHHGHKKYSAEILLECANIHRVIAKQERNKKDKHSHYLDAFNLAQRAISKTEEVLNSICSLFAFNESKNASIPLMRQLALRKINLVEILLDIFHLVISEKKPKNVGEASFHEFVEEFIIEDDAIEQTQQRMAQKYLSQSSEALLQSMAIAFTHNVTDILALSSLEMAECFRQLDPISTSQFLALHQAWRNLCIPVEHFNIVDELPSLFYIVILQHSEDRSQLYSSLIEMPEVSTAQQKGKLSQRMVQAKVSRFPVDPDVFRVLLEKMSLYKQQKMKNHLKQTVIQNLQDSVSKTDVIPTEKIDDSELDLTSDFSEIIEIMEDYLKPTLSQFGFSAVRESQCSAAETGKKKVKDKDTKQVGMQDIVDPYNEGREAETSSPSQKIQKILEKYHDLFKLQWEGVIGNICSPSQAKWEQLLTNCSAFLFCGMERFMSHVLLDCLVAMNIPKCRLVILLDLVRSQQSYQRITNSDIHKSCLRIALERPTETAMLLSLTGVGCIIATQWYTSLEENAERLETLFEMEADSHNSSGDKIEEQTACASSDIPATHPSSFNCVLYGLPNVIPV